MSKKIVYAYRMTSDTGYAPCVFTDGYTQSPLLSLACCKGGQLRHKKGNPEEITEVNTGLRHTLGKNYTEQVESGKVELYVIGILKDRIIWCAQITRIIPMIDYFSDSKTYGDRLDFIYDVKELVDYDAKTGNLVRNEHSDLFHGENMAEQHKRDELGKYVLLSTNFVYFGGKDTDANRIEDPLTEILPKRQESKCYSDSDKESYKEIIKLVDKLMSTKSHINKPTVKLTKDNCQRCQPK